MTPIQLPEVPRSYGDHVVYDSVRVMREPGYTEYQLREYAITDRANVLAAILAIIPGGSICDPQQIADDIRRLLEPSETNSER